MTSRNLWDSQTASISKREDYSDKNLSQEARKISHKQHIHTPKELKKDHHQQQQQQNSVEGNK